MKNFTFLFIALFVLFSFNSFSGVLILEGKYQSKNLYVQNGYAGSGVGFCTYEIRINGKISPDELNSSAFEIDFAASEIKPGTPVVIEIKYKDDCMPKILNPEDIKPKATFEIINLTLDKSGLLNWSTKNETGSLPYVIEQFRWNKWIPVGEVQGSGSYSVNNYSFQTTAHSGENKFRLKQKGYGAVKLSNNVTFTSDIKQPTFEVKKDNSAILFSDETMYEVYDSYGNIVKRGYANSLDISNLEKGSYYLCFDNVLADFKKK
ncbi:MAG TPA: hypothetical protein VLB84_05460 [Bacteroidia bacterium]|nr:hypothetical protein [Bacteroidia bacterium]